jgi:hypothetical protein
MRKALLIVAAAILSSQTGAPAAQRRPHLEPDECAKAAAACEKRCDAKAGADKLSCKTDCRLVETECRNRKH